MDVVIKFPLKTTTKLFCDCVEGEFCPICKGRTGIHPLLNREALKKAIVTVSALKCRFNMASFFRMPAYADRTLGYLRSMQPAPIGTNGCFGVKSVYLEEAPVLHDGRVCADAPLICLSFSSPDPVSLDNISKLLMQSDVICSQPTVSFYDEQRNISIVDPSLHDISRLPQHLRDLPYTNGIYTPEGFFDASELPIEPELDMCLVHIDPYTAEQVISGKDIPQGPLGI